MRGSVLVVLASLATGCAQGSVDVDDSVANAPQNAPVVALAAPGQVPVRASAPAYLARASPGHAFAVSKPLSPLGCMKNAFCDDFEDPTPGSRWSDSVAKLDGVFDFDSPSCSLGSRALRARSSAGGAAYLTLEGATLGDQWVGSLGLSMRLDALPHTVLGGPEIAVLDANGGTTRVGFSVRPEGIALHQYSDSCGGPACEARSDLVTEAKPGEWRRLVFAVEGSNALTPPYGRIEVTVDGGELITLPLVVAPFGGQATVHAGITVADDAPATLRIDDVVFFTR